MRSRLDEAIGVRERLESLLEEWQEPGAAELCTHLEDMLDGDRRATGAIHLERLKPGVYRLRIGSGDDHTLVLKRLNPAISQTDRYVADRWLPALGLGDRCPQLRGAAAERAGSWVWHLYEDLGRHTLVEQRQPEYLAAAVDLIADLHTRAAIHPLLPEIR